MHPKDKQKNPNKYLLYVTDALIAEMLHRLHLDKPRKTAILLHDMIVSLLSSSTRRDFTVALRKLSLRYGQTARQVLDRLQARIESACMFGLREKLNELFGYAILFEEPSAVVAVTCMTEYIRKRLRGDAA